MNTMFHRILFVAVALAFLSPAVRSEKPKADRTMQEDHIKKLEDRLDAAEKIASSAAMDKDYITRVQNQYESYYKEVLHTEMWVLALMTLVLAAVFGFAVRFSLALLDQRTKMAVAEATAQLRNEYSRAMAKEVQKLWDSNAADIKKLKEALAKQAAELEKNLKDRSDFEFQFMRGVGAGIDQRLGDSLVAFRSALRTHKEGKSRALIETKAGALVVCYIFESLRSVHGENYLEQARAEMADTLYDHLDEELAVATLQSPWLTPLINERKPATPEPAASAPAAAVRPAAPTPAALPSEEDLAALDVESEARLVG